MADRKFGNIQVELLKKLPYYIDRIDRFNVRFYIMPEQWQIQTAKNKFSELINRTMKGKPQMITKNGKPVAYVVSIADYEAMTNSQGLKDLLLNSPHKDLEITAERQVDTGREINL